MRSAIALQQPAQAQNLKLNLATASWFLCLSCVLLFGFYLRVYELGDSAYWIDEAFSLEAARQGFWGEFWASPRALLYHGVLNIVIAIFGESPIVARLPSVIASMVGVVAVGLICHHRFGRIAALLALCVMAFAYWHIAWARQVREYAWLMSVFWLAIYLIDRRILSYKSSSSFKYKRLVSSALIVATIVIASALHPFGLLTAVAALLALVLHTYSSGHKIGLALLLSGTAITGCIVAYWWPWPLSFKTVYWRFLLEQYWLLAMLCTPAILCLAKASTRLFLVWLLLVFVGGMLAISTLVPLVNLRYIYFLTPVFAILMAASISVLAAPLKWVFLLGALSALVYQGNLQLIPKSAYPLESIATKTGFRFYTPQPRFDLAYSYINNRLQGKDLVTPYPAISRRYRNIDDTLAIDAKISFSAQNVTSKRATEHYTKVRFADGRALLQLSKQTGVVYILLDQMALERIDQLTKIAILEYGTLVRTWRKRPYSDLFLYKITHHD
jgi:hypothetical protein